MTRFTNISLVVLIASSSAMQAIEWPTLPSWQTVSGYFTVEAARNGLSNTAEFSKAQYESLKAQVQAHPYIAAAIAAGTITVGGVLYKVKKARNAREQLLQDEALARQLDQEWNEEPVAEPSAPSEDEFIAELIEIINQLAGDEEFARQLQADQTSAPSAPTDGDFDAALAFSFQEEYNAEEAQRQEQEAQDAAYAQSIAAE